MASIDIKAMITKKQNDKMKASKLVIKDINRELITALIALPVYGKDVRDEEILTIIINGGVQAPLMDRIRSDFSKKLDKGEVKKVKGEYRDPEGFLVLVPRA